MEASSPARQQWNAAHYAANGRFVATLATGVVDLLAPQPGEHILDLGCGDGALTESLAATGAHLTGVDSSPGMVAAARARDLTIVEAGIPDLDPTTLPGYPFHAVFSNAALHWIPVAAQPRALATAFRSLAPGGRFVAELGGQGNIAAIRTALQATCLPLGIDAEAIAQSFFPSPERYRTLLEQAGFHVHAIVLHPRPTPLPGDDDGMRRWLQTFRNAVLTALPPDARDLALARTIDLLRPVLFDPGDTTRPSLWTADYVRLRVHCSRPA